MDADDFVRHALEQPVVMIADALELCGRNGADDNGDALWRACVMRLARGGDAACDVRAGQRQCRVRFGVEDQRVGGAQGKAALHGRRRLVVALQREQRAALQVVQGRQRGVQCDGIGRPRGGSGMPVALPDSRGIGVQRIDAGGDLRVGGRCGAGEFAEQSFQQFRDNSWNRPGAGDRPRHGVDGKTRGHIPCSPASEVAKFILQPFLTACPGRRRRR